MAAEDEGRTEEPSEYKLEKARKEGRVAKSTEVSGALVLLLCVITLIFLAKWVLSNLVSAFVFFFTRSGSGEMGVYYFARYFIEVLLKCTVPVLLVGLVAGIAGNIIQTKGFIFSLKPIEPKFSKIVPKFGEYFKKTIFSGKGMFGLAKSILKIAVIVVIACIYIKKDIFVIIQIIDSGDIYGALKKVCMMGAQLLIVVSIFFLIISIPDYFVQRHDFMQEMRMTKQEVKEEYKEMEGDPEVKNRLRQMQQQLLQQNIRKAVAESDVVVTNPTHFAVALKYDAQVADAPMVNAKGEDEVAFTIRRIAEENDVPVVENRPVARSLYTELEVGDIIPGEYLQTLALIYAHIDKIRKKYT